MADAPDLIVLLLDDGDPAAEIEAAFRQHSPAQALTIVNTVAQTRAAIEAGGDVLVLARPQLPDSDSDTLRNDFDGLYLQLLAADGSAGPPAADSITDSEVNLCCLPELLSLHWRLWLAQNSKLDIELIKNRRLMVSRIVLASRVELLAQLGYWEWDHVLDRLTYASAGYAALMETTREELQDRLKSTNGSVAHLFPDDAQRYIREEAAAHARGEGFETEYQVRLPSGRVRVIHEISEVKIDDDGKVIRSSGVMQDVSERRRAEEYLSRTLADARRAEKMAKLGTYEWDWVEDKLVACSEEYARLVGISPDDALTKLNDIEFDRKLIHPDDRERVVAAENMALARGEGYDVEYRLVQPGGQVVNLRDTFELEFNSRGEPVRAMGAIQDVTERVELEEQLRQTQKLEAVGQLTGGVAHDFNNLLMVINGNVELSKGLLDADHPAVELLSSAMEAAERGAVLTRRLLAFSRKQSLQLRAVSLPGLLSGMENLLQRTLGETVEVHIETGGGEWSAETDSSQLENALLNLAINARDAMPAGGRLLITVAAMQVEESDDQGGLSPGPYICISVSDTGVGMSAAVMERVFDPFFTTKDVGAGSGLGLSMVYGFMKQTGGHVSVSSEEGTGTEIKLYLKPAQSRELPNRVRPSLKEPEGSGEQVLVVEDDDGVRKLAVRMLTDLGYRPLEAETAAKALSVLEGNPTVALLFSDVVLPGDMSGLDLAEHLANTRPELKILLASGYTPDKRLLGADTRHKLLRKPYTRRDLAQTLHELIAI